MVKQKKLPDPEQVAEEMAKGFTGGAADEPSRKQAVRRWLSAALWAALLIPILFWLRFGTVGDLGVGLTVFLVVYCLLVAFGLFFLRRKEYHSPVALRGDWVDRIGMFWLLACGLGPFIGWLLTAAIPLTAGSWRWVYAGRAVFCIGLPVLTALALLRYARGKAAVVVLTLLLGVTALPVWSGWTTARDLIAGPITRTRESSSAAGVGMETYLPFTGRVLEQDAAVRR
jgi:amino acid transporter